MKTDEIEKLLDRVITCDYKGKADKIGVLKELFETQNIEKVKDCLKKRTLK